MSGDAVDNLFLEANSVHSKVMSNQSPHRPPQLHIHKVQSLSFTNPHNMLSVTPPRRYCGVHPSLPTATVALAAGTYCWGVLAYGGGGGCVLG